MSTPAEQECMTLADLSLTSDGCR